jgi:glycosyltransferase involved in cell wall biosynthesis
MRIAIFSDNFYPELSGITDSILMTGRNLAKRGHQIDFYAPAYSKQNYELINSKVKDEDLGKNINVHRFFSFPFPTPTRQGRLVWPTFWRWTEMKKNMPDIIHTHLFFGCGLEALSAAKHLNRPLVGTSHTPINEFVRFNFFGKNLLEYIGPRFVSWYYNKCNFVSAPSAGIIDDMKKNGFKKPFEVISNPIDTKNYIPVSEDEKLKCKKELGLSENTILCSGRLAPEKNIDVIIKAAELVKKIFPDVSLAITGHGSAKNDLKPLVKEMNLENNIKFFGTVDEPTLIKIYQAADIYAIASTAETQSISLIKAMAAGLPSIGVRARALPEYINKSNGFVVAAGDFQSMSDKIIYLLKNREIRATLGAGGNRLAREFSEEKIADKWEKVYTKTLKH